MNLVFAIKPKDRSIIKDIQVYFSNTHLHISGINADDQYDDKYELKLSDKEKINEWFEHVYIGNKIASVKYEVTQILWSKNLASKHFLLVCKAPEPTFDNLLDNSYVFLHPAVHGFKEVDFGSFSRNGFDFNEVNFK